MRWLSPTDRSTKTQFDRRTFINLPEWTSRETAFYARNYQPNSVASIYCASSCHNTDYTTEKVARQHITVGAFLEIDLGDGYYAYARMLGKASYAIYDLHSSNKITDLNLIACTPILFIVAVHNSVVNSGGWVKIGKKPLEKWFEVLPNKFVQDVIHPERYSLYDPNSGVMIEADRENCVGLERAAVWEAQHVESRIKDHYADKPNIWVEQLRLA